MEQAGVPVKTFISDRHRGNAKWIREAKTQTIHYYDIWHVARSLWKKLLKASKEGGCEKISSWMKGIRRHLYWCATSTKPGFGALIVAKWSSFLRHVANIHSDHPNELYKKCHHEPLQDRLWIKRGRYIIMITIIQQLEKYLLVKQKNQYFYIFIILFNLQELMPIIFSYYKV